MIYQGPRNRGGWPKQTKHFYDQAARRRAEKAMNILIDAQDYVTSKRDMTYDPADICMDPIHRDAWEILQAAKKRVGDAEKAAHESARKALES